MRYRALDTNLLVLLDVLLDTNSVTRTADILGLSQPAISAALGRLRIHFADELLVQVGRASVPTPLAGRLRRPLKELLQQTDALISQRAGFDPHVDTRHFSLLGSDYVASMIGHQVLRETAMFGPNLTVKLESIVPDSYERFERAEIDTAILPSSRSFDDHPSVVLCEERFICVIWEDHPQIGDTMSVEDYVAGRHVIHSSRSGVRQTIVDQAFLDQSGFKRNVAIEVPLFGDILAAIPGTPFIGTVQERLAKAAATRLPIRLLEAPLNFPTMPILLQWHRHLDGDQGLQWFREKIIAVAARLTACGSAP